MYYFVIDIILTWFKTSRYWSRHLRLFPSVQSFQAETWVLYDVYSLWEPLFLTNLGYYIQTRAKQWAYCVSKKSWHFYIESLLFCQIPTRTRFSKYGRIRSEDKDLKSLHYPTFLSLFIDQSCQLSTILTFKSKCEF